MRTRPNKASKIAVAVLVPAALSVAWVSSAVASSKHAKATQVSIGLITKNTTNPFFVKMTEGAKKEAAKAGAKLITTAGKKDGDNATQVAAIESLVARGVKGILITPSNTKAIVPAIKKARAAGVVVIALDTPTEPQSATDALYATNNYTAGLLIGKYAKAVNGSKKAQIATLDLFVPRVTVDVARHNGFLAGFGNTGITAATKGFGKDPLVVCSGDTDGGSPKGQTSMENCLQKNPGINLVYTINEPAAAGAYTALKAAGKEKAVSVLSVDGGCEGVRNVQKGIITATSQQYPLKMASLGVAAVVKFAKTGVKPKGYIDTGVTLITDKPVAGVPSKNTKFGLANCWG